MHESAERLPRLISTPFRLYQARRLTVVSVVTLGVIVLWCGGYWATGYANPLTQFGGVASRWGGEKYLRTRLESETNMAMFHLSYALRRQYIVSAGNGWQMPFPDSWQALIEQTGDYAGPHLRGTLITAYPSLSRSVDPWGRPWVFRIKAFESGPKDLNEVDVVFTVGSLGPDGEECDSMIRDDKANYRRKCDDLIITQNYYGEPISRLPIGTLIQPPLAPKTFTVPEGLWK